MKHFWQYTTSDNNNINLLSEKDGEVRTCVELFGSICRGCGQHSSDLNNQVKKGWDKYLENLEADIIHSHPLWFYDADSKLKEMFKFAEKYIKNNKLDRCKGHYDTLIKTKDIDFANFLMENGYKLIQSHSIGRSDKHSESSGEIEGSSGFFGGEIEGSFSSESNARRLDITEFILQKEIK